MEQMTRLALVEQSVDNSETFTKVLLNLLRQINQILENPDDVEVRTVKCELLKHILNPQPFADYLKSIGFQPAGNDYRYSQDQPLSNLRMAQAAIERKIYFCCGSSRAISSGVTVHKNQTPDLKPLNVLTTTNEFCQKIQSLFNAVLQYEDVELLKLARDHIPLVTLQLLAIDRMRDHQHKIKKDEMKGEDLSFDLCLLMELLLWFKHEFFTWVDAPECEACGQPTTHARTTNEICEGETCRVEVYTCVSCGVGARFPRYNCARTLLRTRRGRCGEWANCFALLCRSLHYDTRYVYDTSDHVWCEIFDYDSNSWLHADPCEGKLDAPLMYCHGWNKKLSYVIAVSRDDLQDVTWRYTTDHKQVFKRRKECSESDLLSTILTLRDHRQRQVTAARRLYLARRTVKELVQLMVERKPGDNELSGRLSGARLWREARGEAPTEHVFTFDKQGEHTMSYDCTTDTYTVSYADGQTGTIKGWARGAYKSQGVQRKEEKDWKMCYLAREEGAVEGTISWAVSGRCAGLRVRGASALYEDGSVEWSAAFDGEPPQPIDLAKQEWCVFPRQFSVGVLRARLLGGRGPTAWQHAQLFRSTLHAPRGAPLHAQIDAPPVPFTLVVVVH